MRHFFVTDKIKKEKWR